MKNSKLRRILLTLACAVLLVSLSVGATLAYLQAQTDVVTNTFTVGKVKIDLDEADVDVYGKVDSAARVTENDYKLIPGHKYTKDPIVYVEAGSEQCYVFVKVVNGIAAIEGGDKLINTQIEELGWKQLVVENVEISNVYYYKDIVDARGEDEDIKLPVFNYFEISGDVLNGVEEGEEEDPNALYITDYDKATVTVVAYAIQSDGFDSAAAAWTAGKFN